MAIYKEVQGASLGNSWKGLKGSPGTCWGSSLVQVTLDEFHFLFCKIVKIEPAELVLWGMRIIIAEDLRL